MKFDVTHEESPSAKSYIMIQICIHCGLRACVRARARARVCVCVCVSI